MELSGILKAIVLILVSLLYAYFIGGTIPYIVLYLSIVLVVAGFIGAKLNTRITAYCYTETVNAQVGSKIKVVVEIKNESGWPVPWVQCWVKMPQTFYLFDNLGCYNFSLSPHQKVRIYEEIECKNRGAFHWGRILLRTGDIFGIFTRSWAGGDEQTLTVLPQIYDIGEDLGELFGRKYGEIPSSMHPARRGSSFLGVKRYDVSDGISRIHWKASARSERLLVKQFQEQKMSEFTILINLNEKDYAGKGPDSSSEKAITLAASLASVGTRKGHGVGLKVYGQETMSIPVGYGKGHFSLMLKSLVKAQSGENMSAAELIGDDIRMLSKNGCPFVIVGNVESELASNLIRLNSRGQRIVLLVLAAETFEETTLDFGDRDWEIAHLRASGVPVLLIDKDTDLRLVFRGPEYDVG